jgi:cytochrome c oxidase subunit 1
MVISDRHFNACFLDIIRGGDLLFFQHLLRFFSHPEAYILILPGFGLISEIIAKYSNKIIFGRDSMILSIIIIGILGMIV